MHESTKTWLSIQRLKITPESIKHDTGRKVQLWNTTNQRLILLRSPNKRLPTSFKVSRALQRRFKTPMLLLLKSKDTDIEDCHEEVRDDSYTVPLAFFGFCGCPIQSVQDVLAKGREEAVCHLNQHKDSLKILVSLFISLCHSCMLRKLFNVFMLGRFNYFSHFLHACILLLVCSFPFGMTVLIT